jgi:tetratricopeptide (TPR) repeat protein
VVACGRGATHERQADRHYRDGAFGLAVEQYRAAQRVAPRPEVWGKLGAAALAAGDPAGAVEAFERLAAEDPSRTVEAARGVERAARQALRQGDAGPVVTAALLALRRLTPDRPLGRLAREAGTEVPGGEALASLLPAAIAASDGGRGVDRLLLRHADGLRVRLACREAVRSYQTALRRSREDVLREAAARGLADCALRLGLAALEGGAMEETEGWLLEAISADPAGDAGIRARIAWGDARERQGDRLGAMISWQAVMAMTAAPDSLRALAMERISMLGGAGRGGELP